MLGDLLGYTIPWAIPVTIVFLLLAHLVKPLRIYFLPVAALFFVLFGQFLMQGARDVGSTIQPGFNTLVATVEEADTNDKDWKKVILRVRREKSRKNWADRDQKILVYCQDQLREGDIILVRTELQQIKNAGNPGEFYAETYWRSKNIVSMGFLSKEDYTLIERKQPGIFSSFFNGIRAYLSLQISNHLNENEASLARALILGDKSLLSLETRETFGNAGAMHVLAISGLHVGIIMYLLFFLFKRFTKWISRRTAVVVTVLFLWVFAGVTGWSPSVVRATLMFSLLLIGQQWGRSGNAMNTLFFSAFLLLLYDPLLIFDIGFQLSYGAMLGIFVFFDRVRSLVKTRSWLLTKAWEGTALGISAQMFTIPLVLYHFHQFPNYFWLTNLGIMCLAGVILALGMTFFALHFIPFVNVGIAFLLGYGLYALAVFVSWVDSLPWSVATGFNLHLAEVVIFVCLMLLLTFAYRQRALRIGAIVLILALVGYWQWNRFEATQKSELVVFNSNVPVIACKDGQVIRVFYAGKKEKARRLAQSYSKLCPGELELMELNQGITTVRFSEKQVELVRTEAGIEISTKDQKWALRTRYSSEKQLKGKQIDMPYLESNDSYHHLKNGAFRTNL